MAKKKEVVLLFNFSYGELIAQCLEKSYYFNRDVADLTPRGVTAARITAFNDQTTSFSGLPTDEALRGEQEAFTEVLTAKREILITSIQDILGIAALTFGEHSGKYHSFGSTDLNRLTHEALYFKSDNVETRGTTYLTDMGPHGLTSGMITTLNTQQGDLKTAIKNRDGAIANRDIGKQTRRTAANALYAEMKDMAGTAYNYYVTRDEAKANDYVIYESTANQTHWLRNLIPAQTYLMTEKTFLAGANIHIYNPGTTPLIFALVANSTDAVTAGINLGPGLDQIHPVEDFGPLTNHFLKVKNDDSSTVGRFELRIL